jgi:hypothetical protein
MFPLRYLHTFLMSINVNRLYETVYVSQTALSSIFYYSECITSCGDFTVCMMEKGRYKLHCSSFPNTWVHIQFLVVVRLSHLVSFVCCVVFFLSSCFFFHILPPMSLYCPFFALLCLCIVHSLPSYVIGGQRMDNTETQEDKEWTIQRHRRAKKGQYRDTGGQRMDNTET